MCGLAATTNMRLKSSLKSRILRNDWRKFMNNIFVIDKSTKKNLGILDFIPRKDERIVLKLTEWTNIECVVACVLYEPLEHATLIFVDVVEPYYSKMVSEIKWS